MHTCGCTTQLFLRGAGCGLRVFEGSSAKARKVRKSRNHKLLHCCGPAYCGKARTRAVGQKSWACHGSSINAGTRFRRFKDSQRFKNSLSEGELSPRMWRWLAPRCVSYAVSDVRSLPTVPDSLASVGGQPPPPISTLRGVWPPVAPLAEVRILSASAAEWAQ